MEYLPKVFIDLKYDIRAFLEIIYNTKTYQRKSWQGELDNYAFRGLFPEG